MVFLRIIITVVVSLVSTIIYSESISVIDGLNREVYLDNPAKRVVSIAPSATEIVFALNSQSILIGRDEYSNFPPEALQIQSIGSVYPNVNIEIVLSLKPDLVLAAGITPAKDIQALTAVGIPVYAGHKATNFEEIYADIAATGMLINNKDQALKLINEMQLQVAEIVENSNQNRPLVFYELDGTDPSKPWTIGAGTFIEHMISLAGAENLGNIQNQQYYQIGSEELVSINPEIIIVGTNVYGENTSKFISSRPGWQNIKAVLNKNIYSVDGNVISRPGPRVIEGLKSLTTIIRNSTN